MTNQERIRSWEDLILRLKLDRLVEIPGAGDIKSSRFLGQVI